MRAYLAALLVARIAMVTAPGRLTHNLERKQAVLPVKQMLFSVEVVLLAGMLIISVVAALGPPPNENDRCLWPEGQPLLFLVLRLVLQRC